MLSSDFKHQLINSQQFFEEEQILPTEMIQSVLRVDED